MSVDPNSTLFKAILAMDSYSRDYLQAVRADTSHDITETALGAATILLTSEDEEAVTGNAQDTGFYAIAYQYVDGNDDLQTVISYRGTDEGLFSGNDRYKAFPIGGGWPDTPQSKMAFEFYQSVYALASAESYPDEPNIALTGHSLGGGLAGLVAATYGLDAVLFDNLAFETSVDTLFSNYNSWKDDTSAYAATYADEHLAGETLGVPTMMPSPEFLSLVFGSPSGTLSPDYDGLSTIAIAGEALGFPFVPGDHEHQENTPITEKSLGEGVEDALGVIGIGEPDAYDLHNVATLVIRLFADTEVSSSDPNVLSTNWNQSAQYFWPVMYSNSFAEAIGMDGVTGRYNDENGDDGHGFDKTMRTLIAYSAIDNGDDTTDTTPYGDTGIRAFYNDANDFGAAIEHSDNTWLTNPFFAEIISETFIQYAADLALHQVFQSDYIAEEFTALDGVLTYTDETNNHTLTLKFDDDLWTFPDSETPVASIVQGGILQYVNDFQGYRVGSINTGLTHADFALTAGHWTSDVSELVERIIFPRFELGTTIIDSNTSGDKVTLFIGTTGKDVVKPVEGNNILVMGVDGRDDTVDYTNYTGGGITVHITNERYGNAFVEKGEDGVDGQDLISNAERIVGTTGDDTFYIPVGGLPHLAIVGNGGHDTYILPGSGGGGGGRPAFIPTSSDSGKVDPGVNPGDYRAIPTGGGGVQLAPNPDGAHPTGPSYYIPPGADGKPPMNFTIDNGTDRHPLSDFPPGEPPPPPPLPDDIRDDADLAYQGYCPLVLDLTGDGINLTSLNGEGSVYWDHDNNGFREASAWIGEGTGLLCVDNNENGAIDSQSELFGTQIGAANGFSTLADYDSDNDDAITSSDDDWDKLLVWTDDNHDGVSQEDELHTLDELEITSIDINYTNVNYQISGNDIKQESTFEIDGNTRTIVDAWLQQDSFNSIYGGEYTPNILAMLEPNARGYGSLPELFVAMSNDEDLLAMVDEVAHQTPQDLFSAEFGLVGKIENIMYQWAGVAEDDPEPNDASWDDIRRIEFLDAFTSQTHRFANGNETRYFEAYELSFDWVATNILGQSSLNDLFGNPVYDLALDSLTGGDWGDGTTVLRFTPPAWSGINTLIDSGYDDIYVFAPGYGSETLFTIEEETNDTNDTLLLGGVNPEDVRMWVDGDGDLIVQYTDEDSVQIAGNQSGGTDVGTRVEQILFDDGTVWDLTNGLTLHDTDDGHEIVGTADADTITGAGGADTIYGCAGNDVLDGGAGNDVLQAGDGNDTLTGGDGTDALQGNDGNDTLDGGDGADSMAGGDGNDTYIVDNASDVVYENGSTGTDTVLSSVSYTLPVSVEILTLTGSSDINGTGSSGSETITGNSGNNTLDGSSGADTLIGGAGNDTYVVDNAGDVVTEGSSAGTDIVLASVSYTLGSNVENLTLTGSSAINGSGNSLDNTLTGNSGNNTLDGGAGADTMAGGAGNDTYIVDDSGDVVIENTSEGTDTVQANASYTLGSNIEKLTLTGSSNIDGTGNTLDNVILGNSGVNILTGNDGNDTLDGGAGADTMIGGAGNDSYLVDNSGDVVTEGSSAGTDAVTATVSYTLGSNIENLWLGGSSNIDGTGNSANNGIHGNSGDNTLDGGAGWDSMYGGDGNDTYIFDSLMDWAYEEDSAGTDTVRISVSGYTLDANVENLTLTGSSNLDGTGNTLANVLTGNSGDNSLDGASGADTMIGGAGNDTYIVDNAGDVVTEGSSAGTDTVIATVSYTLSSNVENLTLINLGGNINGTGNSLDNTITGNGWNNTLSGGGGDDTLAGNGGTDTFVFNDNSYGSVDTVTDFSGDKIDIRDLLSSYNPGPDTITDWVRITTVGSDSKIEVDEDGTGSGFSWTQIATLQGVTGMTDEAALVTAGTLIVS